METESTTVDYEPGTLGSTQHASMPIPECKESFVAVSANFNEMLGVPIVHKVRAPPSTVDIPVIREVSQDDDEDAIAWDLSTLHSCGVLLRANMAVFVSYNTSSDSGQDSVVTAPVFEEDVEFFEFLGGRRRLAVADVAEGLHMNANAEAVAACRLYAVGLDLTLTMEGGVSRRYLISTPDDLMLATDVGGTFAFASGLNQECQLLKEEEEGDSEDDEDRRAKSLVDDYFDVESGLDEVEAILQTDAPVTETTTAPSSTEAGQHYDYVYDDVDDEKDDVPKSDKAHASSSSAVKKLWWLIVLVVALLAAAVLAVLCVLAKRRSAASSKSGVMTVNTVTTGWEHQHSGRPPTIFESEKENDDDHATPIIKPQTENGSPETHF